MSKRNRDNDAQPTAAAEQVIDHSVEPVVDEPGAVCEEAVAGEAEEVEAVEGSSESAAGVAEELEAVRGEVADWKDKYLRLSAEFDNYRKRTLREKGDLISRAAGETLLRLLPVVDDFDRALQVTGEVEDYGALREGLVLVHRNLLGFLRGAGVTEIEAHGQELDIDYHEAVAMSAAPSADLRGRIIDVVRKGYLLNGHVLRHAQVVVGTHEASQGAE